VKASHDNNSFSVGVQVNNSSEIFEEILRATFCNFRVRTPRVISQTGDKRGILRVNFLFLFFQYCDSKLKIFRLIIFDFCLNEIVR